MEVEWLFDEFGPCGGFPQSNAEPFVLIFGDLFLALWEGRGLVNNNMGMLSAAEDQ